MTTAVYRITNTLNNKFYIGSSINVNARVCLLYRALTLQKHHCKHLQRSYNKYGKEYFVFEILDELLDNENLIQAEQDWIDFCRIEGVEIYNTYIWATGSKGYKHSDETKNKISNFAKGNSYRLGKPQPPSVIELIRIRMLGNTIRKGKSHTEESKEKMRQYRAENPIIHTKEGRDKISQAHNKAVYQIDLTNIIINKYNSIIDAARSVGVDPSSISKACSGKLKKVGGYRWEYIND